MFRKSESIYNKKWPGNVTHSVQNLHFARLILELFIILSRHVVQLEKRETLTTVAMS